MTAVLTDEREKRKRNLVVIAVVLFLLVTATAVEVGIKAPELPVASNVVVIALFNLNLVVFLLLLVLLFRNLVKLSFERRHKILGSKFKTKLVVAFLSLALAPSIMIFLIASNLINTSIEGWFKLQVERPLDESMRVAQTFYERMQDVALRHGQHIAAVLARDRLLGEERREKLIEFLQYQQEQYGLAGITVYSAGGQEVVHVKDPVLAPSITSAVNMEQVRMALGGRQLSTRKEIANGDLIQGMVPVLASPQDPRVVGTIVVAIHVPERLEAQVRSISQAFQEYKQLKLLKQPIKGIYILLFLLMTLVIVFSVTWFGLYLAKGITVPIQRLAEGTREVAAGNLDYRVSVEADDEVGILVTSFNKMTEDLTSSKTQLERAYTDLQAKHAELIERRRYTETILEAVATGVVSADSAGRVTTVNRAAAQMLGLDPAAAVGRHYAEALAGAEYRDLVALIQRMDRFREGSIERQLTVARDGARLTLLTSVTALAGPEREYLGTVLVFDDLTALLSAQRLAAWREVAQRIAHEIKNPLTPIQLSAQRLRRRLAGRLADDGGVLEECTGTIIGEVEGLRRLVDEFSRFARMPALAPTPTDLHRLVEGVVALYGETHPAVTLRTELAPDLPVLEADGDQLKRALLNLLDNAVEAGATDVLLATRWDRAAGRVEVVVADNGPGVAAEVRDKLFLPYFSTKTTGMGLGLPIVHQIVTDHGGHVRVEGNRPKGSRFVIDLPAVRPGNGAGAAEVPRAPLTAEPTPAPRPAPPA
ncbi:MAG: HAMP domain-containing protein [Candidatus Rokubacteria bacterium]|nr:HAMP domain-containing protein [Candidatus Rokubacteria bacterium]